MTEPINWDRHLAFTDTGERAWLSHFEPSFHNKLARITDENVAVVTDKEGAGYTYDRATGEPIEAKGRWIANFMTEQEQAQARVAIKRAQHLRAQERLESMGRAAAGDAWGSW